MNVLPIGLPSAPTTTKPNTDIFQRLNEIQQYFTNWEQDLIRRETELKIREQSCFKTYTTRQAADLIHVDDRTIKKYINSGELRAALIGKEYTIREDELIRFVKESEKMH